MIVSPWLLFGGLNDAIACHRWAGWPFLASIGTSALAACIGWHLVRRAAARYDDANLGDLLTPVPDAPEWTQVLHAAQFFKRQHQTWCQKRWRVTTRTSAWERFRWSWRDDALRAVVCLVAAVHALWLE